MFGHNVFWAMTGTSAIRKTHFNVNKFEDVWEIR